MYTKQYDQTAYVRTHIYTKQYDQAAYVRTHMYTKQYDQTAYVRTHMYTKLTALRLVETKGVFRNFSRGWGLFSYMWGLSTRCDPLKIKDFTGPGGVLSPNAPPD